MWLRDHGLVDKASSSFHHVKDFFKDVPVIGFVEEETGGNNFLQKIIREAKGNQTTFSKSKLPARI